MIRTSLYIYDPDIKYQERLTDSLKKKKQDIYDIYGTSDEDEICDAIENAEGIFLVHEDFAGKLVKLDNIVLLSEKKPSASDKDRIYKYQSCSDIFRKILLLTQSESCLDELTAPMVERIDGLISVFSPADSSGCTDTSLDMCRRLGARTLYMNITCVPSHKELCNNDREDLIELLYLSNNKRKISKNAICACISSIDGIDYVSMGSHTMEYSVIKADEWIGLIDMIKDVGGYENVVLELDGGIQDFMKILNISSEVYYYRLNSEAYEYQFERFRKILKHRGEKELLERMRVINAPKRRQTA